MPRATYDGRQEYPKFVEVDGESVLVADPIEEKAVLGAAKPNPKKAVSKKVESSEK